MSRRDTKALIEDIQEGIHRILLYTDGKTHDEFLADLRTQDAVVRNIEIIGEATKKLPVDFKQDHADIPWKAIAGTRDKLVHDYFGVNYDVVWTIVRNDLPSLLEQINAVLEDLHRDQ